MIDPLSDVLRSVQLASAVFFARDASGCWAAGEPPADVLSAHGVEHVIQYHVVTEGACWGGARGEPSTRLEAGDVLVLPHGDAELSLHAGAHERAQVICGFLGCNARPFSPLLATLPRVMHLPGAGHRDSVRRRLVELALAESAANRAGSDCMLVRLGELLFAEVVRQHADSLPAQNAGWFAGLRDAGIGRALHRLHERPAHPWTLEALAKNVGMSRSTLAERFVDCVGIPPIQYLAQWRIQLAASLLRSSKSSLAEIALRVGYGSEAALSRAFKRQLGVSPTPYRRADLGLLAYWA
jgi:AraC-like DNA-binding protein